MFWTIVGAILFVYIALPFIYSTFYGLGWLWTILAFIVNPILGIIVGILWYIVIKE